MYSPLRSLASRWMLTAVGFVFSVVKGLAIIGAAYQMQLGNPSSATATTSNHVHYLIQRDQYAMDYNDTTREPNWVSWDLTTGDVGGSGRSSFTTDPDLPAGFTVVGTGDYSGSGYDRGHMCPSADRTVDTANNKIVFYMSNMVPQAPDNNQGVWANFENDCRSLASQGNELLITCGPSGFSGSTIASGVAIPGYVWKIVLVVPTGSGLAKDRITASTRVIAIKIPNISGVRSDPWTKYITSIAQIEADTGYAFLTDLPSSVASVLRAKVDGQTITGLPTITTQPGAQAVAVGGTATFAVAATSTTDTSFTYQWSKDDGELTGQTGSTLTLTNVQPADAGNYAVQVANSVGSATSNAAVLALTGIAPAITTGPAAQTASAGATVTFSVVASGSPTLTYQWRKNTVALANGANVAGATSATLTLTNVQSADAAFYDAVVTNSVNAATTPAVTLTVNPAAPTITTQPAAQSVVAGGTATFSVVAAGTSPLTYVWRKGGIALSDGGTVAGAATATLKLTGVTAADAASYDVVVSNGVGLPATSNAVALTISTATAGQLSYPGGTYTQNFDTLPTAGTFTFSGAGPFALDGTVINATGLGGWQLAKYSGTGTLALFNVGTGSGTTGSVYSFGAAGTNAASDRALGSVSSNATVSRFGVVLVNTTGRTITEFTLGYAGEEWRNGGNATAQKLAFEYAPGGTDINTGTFVAVAGLDFTSPVATATAGALDGNASANRAVISAKVTGLSWAAGQTLVLRWTDANDSGNDHGLAIDDLTFTTPDPVVAPTILTSPSSATVLTGTDTTLTVGATGTATLGYQWRKGGVAITGNATATTASLVLTGVTAADAGSYDVLVTNSAGAATSAAAVLTVRTPQEAWRQANFGTATDSGSAANTADPDGDGVPNQLEYALGLTPTSAASAALPVGQMESGAFVFRFTRPKAVTDLTYTVQKSADLLAWTTLATTVESSTATTETLVASIPAAGTKGFVRLNVGAVTTVPVGYMNFPLAGGGATTAFGIPLDDPIGPVSGLRAAKVESFTATTLTNSAGGWSPGVLANAGAPWAVRLTSGPAAGRLLDVTANTATTLTVGSTAGVAVGDTFELVALDTLGTLFGVSTFTSGTSATTADVVQVRSGTTWVAYFYDSNLGYWHKTSGSTANANNTVIRSGAGLLVTRRGSALALTFTGRVLDTTFRMPVNNASSTVLTTGYPMDITLGNLAVQLLLSGWRNGTATSTADAVGLYNGSAWVAYVFNGTNWQTTAGANSDSVTIPAGTPILIQRPGASSGTTDLIRTQPY